MKLSVILTLCVLAWNVNYMCAETAQSKQDKKEIAKKSKQLKAEGWTVYGQSAKLNDALTALSQQTDSGKLQITGLGQAASEDAAIRKATLHASKQYATMKGTCIEGDTQTEAQTSADGEKEMVQATYYSNTKQKVEQLKPALCLIRQTSNGTVEAQVFCLVNAD